MNNLKKFQLNVVSFFSHKIMFMNISSELTWQKGGQRAVREQCLLLQQQQHHLSVALNDGTTPCLDLRVVQPSCCGCRGSSCCGCGCRSGGCRSL